MTLNKSSYNNDIKFIIEIIINSVYNCVSKDVKIAQYWLQI